MKKFLIATAALASVALVGPANAADLPVKAAPMVMPALYNWTGLYVGAEAGGIMGQWTDFFFCDAPGVDCGASDIAHGGSNFGHPLHGGFLGGEAGIDWQAPGSRWVFGIVGDGNWSELEETLTCPNFSFFCGTKIRNFETVRGQIGYALGPTGSFLVFLTGGWATADQAYVSGPLTATSDSTCNFPACPDYSEHRRANGFVVGGGAAYGITPWLSVKGEVLYVNLGRENYAGNGCDGGAFFACPVQIKTDFVLARMSLDWRFNWGKGKGPVPVVARY